MPMPPPDPKNMGRQPPLAGLMRRPGKGGAALEDGVRKEG
jgi:hypothetical protein